MNPEDAYPNSFRIGFGMLLVAILWAVVDGGIWPYAVAAAITFLTIFLFPFILIWDMKNGD